MKKKIYISAVVVVTLSVAHAAFAATARFIASSPATSEAAPKFSGFMRATVLGEAEIRAIAKSKGANKRIIKSLIANSRYEEGKGPKPDLSHLKGKDKENFTWIKRIIRNRQNDRLKELNEQLGNGAEDFDLMGGGDSEAVAESESENS